MPMASWSNLVESQVALQQQECVASSVLGAFKRLMPVGNRAAVRVMQALGRHYVAVQIVEAKEAGAAGVLGNVANVSGPRGAPMLSSYAAAIGLDCPVEVGHMLLVIRSSPV